MVATAIGAAIPVLIVGTIVWFGITKDRQYWLDRRLDEAAGFAIPFLPRGLDQIPRSPSDADAIITVRRGDTVTSNSSITLPKLDQDYADTYINGKRYRVRTVDIPAPQPMSVEVGATYDETIADTNAQHRRVVLVCAFAIAASAIFAWLLATFAVRPFKRLASRPVPSMPATRRRRFRCAAPLRPSKSPRQCGGCCSASGTSRTARRRRSPRPATSRRCRRTSCALR
ncbi:sensor-type histidine kinase prrB domain protein [Mycobacterium xenopi 3993]|nr:sensor-type histidine kinase prrB domain protein [Mycobacterium xenopi 3993]